ncbi:MAG: hypothetical protein IKF78_03380 [Atopobiaceae bacterium]|nr:hypothetical protein [Atopobiaceae bacterium]
MTSVIPVKFAYAVRDLWFDQANTDAQEGDHVICSTERGTEIGLATAPAREVSATELKQVIGNSTLKPVLRIATDADLDRANELAIMGDEAFPMFRDLVKKSGLDMKPVGVEYLFGGEKVVCYFAAEERVDFRQLVRDVSHELHQRIDMRQIGVREESAMVGGFGHCGQELCCARFGLSFEPVSIRMAKEQDLPLTSNKISGACGRLMCCLRYEFEAYRDFKGRAPKRNAVIDTPLGKAKVVEYDTPKEQLALRIESGKIVRIPLAEMVASKEAVKKSEELHCPCRPDTVVRASLEKLSSPDVQMALAELDRKNGVVVEDEFDSADIFVEAKPRKRRNRRKAARAEAPVAPSTKQKQEPAGKNAAPAEKRVRRRRRKRSAAGTAESPVTAQGSAASNAAAQSAPTQSADKPKEGRRRRRHRNASAKPAVGTPAGTSASQTPKGQGAKPKPKRRPGDRGGQKTPHGGQKAPQQKAPQQKATQQKAPQPQQKAPQAEEGTQKRRRRRRRRSGGDSNKQAPQ